MSKRLPLAVALALAVLGSTALVGFTGTRPQRIGGTFTMTYTQRTPTPLPDLDGHILLSTASQGTNQSTGPTPFMAGAAVTNSELADLVQGQGTHQGYVTMTLDGASVIVQWKGVVSTVLGPDQTPATSFAGEWTYVRGAKGRGTYSGRITGADTYSVDWKGEVSR